MAAASITTAQPVSAGDESTTQASQHVQGSSSGSTTANTAAMSNVVTQNDDVPASTRRASVSSAAGLELLLLLCQPHPMKADLARARSLVREVALVLQLGMVITVD